MLKNVKSGTYATFSDTTNGSKLELQKGNNDDK